MSAEFRGEAIYAVWHTRREDRLHTTAKADPSFLEYEFRESIVRCKDCKYMFDWAYGRMLCKMWADADIDEPEGNVLYPCVKPDGFCAWGERRDA